MSTPSVRASTPDDVSLVHEKFQRLLDESGYYPQEFIDHERSTMSEEYLRSLHEKNPWHLLIMELDGEVSGFQITADDPANSKTIILLWTYLFPENRHSGMFLHSMRSLLEIFRSQGYTLFRTYTDASNEVILKTARRFGCQITGVDQWFGNAKSMPNQYLIELAL